MFECSITNINGIKWLQLKGRIDSMSSPEVEKQIHELIDAGEKLLIVNFAAVQFLSSAGLRALLTSQKAIKSKGGEVLFYSVPQNILEIFKLSGFDKIFKIIESLDEVHFKDGKGPKNPNIISKDINGVTVKYFERDNSSGTFKIIGSQKKLFHADYAREDIVPVKASDIQHGSGLASLASLNDDFDDYKNLFGETMVIDGNIFVFPAIKNPTVDYLINVQKNSNLEYQFFHGFSFNGAYNYIVSFESIESHIELGELRDVLFSISSANKIGVVLLAKSKGILGMHLKKVPIVENKPKNAKKIYDSDNFYEWVNYDVKPDFVNNIVAGSGIIANNRNEEEPEIQELFSSKKNIHVHAGIFEKEPLDISIDQFSENITKVLTQYEVSRIHHLLDKSRFSSGIVGIIDLDVFRL